MKQIYIVSALEEAEGKGFIEWIIVSSSFLIAQL
jgi:hypothetical protein